LSEHHLVRLHSFARQIEPGDLQALSSLLRRLSRLDGFDRARGELVAAKGLYQAGVFLDVAVALAENAVKMNPSSFGFVVLAINLQQEERHQGARPIRDLARKQADAPSPESDLIDSWVRTEVQLRQRPSDSRSAKRARLDDFFKQLRTWKGKTE
jgi:hypothetical protein